MQRQRRFPLMFLLLLVSLLVFGCKTSPGIDPAQPGDDPEPVQEEPVEPGANGDQSDPDLPEPDAEPDQTGQEGESGNEALQAYLATLVTPEPPHTSLLESSPEAIIEWFTQLELWTQGVILAPGVLAEQDVPVDAAIRAASLQAMEAYYVTEAADELLSFYWVPSADDPSMLELVATEGPAVLPFMESVTVQSVDGEQVVFHATNPSPSLYEEIIRTYTLRTAADAQEFRVLGVGLDVIR